MTTAGTETKTLGQKAVDRFTEMMVERMEQMKSVGWHKGVDWQCYCPWCHAAECIRAWIFGK